MDFLLKPYSEGKIKPYLKMATQRISIANNKKSTSTKHQKREISQLLGEHKDEKARIKVEHIIRDDFTIEGFEVIGLLCELVHERIRQITNSKECPDDLKEAVSSLIWASKNVDIEELKTVGQQLTQKFGKEFAKAALENSNGEVNPRLIAKLVYQPPSSFLVVKYLEAIAEHYGVDWKHTAITDDEHISKDAPFSSPSGASIPMAPGSGISSAYAPTLMEITPGMRVPGVTPDELAEQEEFRRRLGQMNGETLMRPTSDYITQVPILGAPAVARGPPASVAPVYSSAPPMSFSEEVPTATPIVDMGDIQPEKNNFYSQPSTIPSYPAPSVPASTNIPSVTASAVDPFDELQARLNALR